MSTRPMKTVVCREELVEANMEKMEKQQKNLEGNKIIFADKAKHVFKCNQKKIFTKNDRLLKLPNLIKPPKNNLTEKENVKELQKLIDSQKHCDWLIQDGNTRIAEQDLQIKAMEEELKILNMSRTQGVEQKHSAHRHLQALENQYHRLSQQFNETLSNNAQLRLKIVKLRIKKVNYVNRHQKLMNQMSKYKSDLDAMKQRIKLENKIKSKIETKMQAMQEKADNEKRQYDIQTEKLKAQLDKEAKLKEFSEMKWFDRTQLDDYKLKLKREAWAKEKEKTNREEEIGCYRAVYQDLQQLFGLQSVESLEEHFENTEDVILSDINLANHLYSDVLDLQNRIQALEEKNSHLENTCNKEIAEQEMRIKNLEQELQNVIMETEKCKENNKINSSALNEFYLEIENFFTQMNCDPPDIQSMFGFEKGINSFNVTMYLCAIGEKVNQLVQAEEYKQRQEGEDDESKEYYKIPRLSKKSFAVMESVKKYIPELDENDSGAYDMGSDILDFDGLKALALESALANEK